MSSASNHDKMPCIERHTGILNPDFSGHKAVLADPAQLQALFNDVDALHRGRNTVIRAAIGDTAIAIKRFGHRRNINAYISGKFARSKAEKSYNAAVKLLENGIATPKPIAFLNGYAGNRLVDSFYVCEFMEHTHCIGDFVNKTDTEALHIQTKFAEFTYQLHQHNFFHADYNSGNTLINLSGDSVNFALIDLNRLKIKPLTDKKRLANFTRLTDNIEVMENLAAAYAQYSGINPSQAITLLLDEKHKHWHRLKLKAALKRLVGRR